MSVLVVCLQAALPASAETRIALIIGNGDYARANLRLANPVNDATAMQRALQQAGFETIVRLNAKRLDFYRAVEEFSTRIARDPHAVGLFYYAGHGVQSDGVNYLIPVDAEIESDADLEASAFDVARVLRGMSVAQNEMNIVILDACRDNPLPRSARGMERGLARMQAPSGTFIAYAAAPDQSAQDGGRGGNGVFTGELVKAMGEPGLPLEQMFKKVIAGVDAQTHGKQRPWSEASLQGDFYFHAALPAAVAKQADVDPRQVELTFWESIKDSRNPADFEAYLRKYPHGEFAGIASNRVKLSAPLPQAAPQAAPQTAVLTAPAVKKKKRDPRCESILQRVQLGETLDDKDRAIVQERCQ
ncbi:MAG: caspase family protein [Steroidobacteraceae bacterium]